MTKVRAALIEGLLPPGVAFHECPPEPDFVQLHPLENRQLATRDMSVRRRRDYALGRWCAHEAMAAFDRSQEPLLTGTSRAPAWPEGLIGSITHCNTYCAAAVAKLEEFAGIGIDAEQWRNFPSDIQKHVATEEEFRLSNLDLSDMVSLALFFSAKESLFKALNPMTGLFFDFLSISMRIDISSGDFFIDSETLPQIALYKPNLVGRFLITDELVLTSTLVYP